MVTRITPLTDLPGELSLVVSGGNTAPELVPAFDAGTGRRSGGGRNPGHLHSAAPWMVLAAVRGIRLHVRNVMLAARELAWIDLLVRMGVRIREDVETLRPDGSVGHLDLRGGVLQGIEIPPAVLGDLSDGTALLAVLAAFARGRTVLRGPEVIQDARLFALLCQNLRALGIVFEELDDGLSVTGPCRLKGATLHAAHDQDLTRALTLAGFLAAEDCILREAVATEDGFPRMFPGNFQVVE